MKFLGFILVTMISYSANAQLGWFLAGALVGSSSKPRAQQVVVRDEFSMTVDQIRNALPAKYSSRSTQPTYEFEVANAEKVRQYFTNEGYLVTRNGNKLSFNYKNSYELYKIDRAESEVRQKEIAAFMDKAATVMKWAFYVFLGGVFIVSLIQSVSMTFDFIVKLGPNSPIFKAYDYKGVLTTAHNKRKKQLTNNWKIINKEKS